MAKLTIVIATKNRHKVEEIQEIFRKSSLAYNLLGIDSDISEPAEDGLNFQENAKLKARYYSQFVEYPVVSEDSGLCIEALGGLPGLNSKRFIEEAGGTDKAFQKLQDMLKEFKPPHKAFYICSLCYYDKNSAKEILVEEKLHGHISFPARGNDGFGYDPIFIPDGYDKTLAELGQEVKNNISHRNKAFNKCFI